MLSGLKLYRQPPAQIPEKQARSIKYPLTVAKLLLAKDIDDFVFKDTPINEGEVPIPCSLTSSTSARRYG